MRHERGEHRRHQQSLQATQQQHPPIGLGHGQHSLGQAQAGHGPGEQAARRNGLQQEPVGQGRNRERQQHHGDQQGDAGLAHHEIRGHAVVERLRRRHQRQSEERSHVQPSLPHETPLLCGRTRRFRP